MQKKMMTEMMTGKMLEDTNDLDGPEDQLASLMLFHEPMIHLKTDKLKCDVMVTQDELDGLYALHTWLDGYAANGGNGVPGQYELLMVYRRLRAAHNAQQRKTLPESMR